MKTKIRSWFVVMMIFSGLVIMTGCANESIGKNEITNIDNTSFTMKANDQTGTIQQQLPKTFSEIQYQDC